MSCKNRIPNVNQGETIPIADTCYRLKIFYQEMGADSISEMEEFANNHRVAITIARMAQENFCDLIDNPEYQKNPALVKERTEEFRQFLAVLNRGAVPDIDLRIDFENKYLNLDYQSLKFTGFGPVERSCRGFYVDLGQRTPNDNPILVYPMQKFHNLGESEALPLEKVSNYLHARFYEKVDGTMITARRLKNDELVVFTRRQHQNIYTDRARELLEASNWRKWFFDNTTYSLEVVLKDGEDTMPRAGGNDDGLYLLSSRNHFDGSSRMSDEINELPADSGIKKPNVTEFSGIEQAAEVIKDLKGTEGYVAVINTNSEVAKTRNGDLIPIAGGTLRYKIKTTDYLQKARLLKSTQKNLRLSQIVMTFRKEESNFEVEPKLSAERADSLQKILQKQPVTSAEIKSLQPLSYDGKIISQAIKDHFINTYGDDVYAFQAKDIEKVCDKVTKNWQKSGDDFVLATNEFTQSTENNYKKFIFTKSSIAKLPTRHVAARIIDKYSNAQAISAGDILALLVDMTDKEES